MRSNIATLTTLVSLSLFACGGSTIGSSSSGASSDNDTGATSSPVSICDGSTAPRFRYVSGGGMYDTGQTVMVENGSIVLVVDGTCHFWTYDWNGGQVRTGALTDAQVDALDSNLHVDQWGAWQAQPTGGCSDGGGFEAAFDDKRLDMGGCGADAPLQSYLDFFGTVDRLYTDLQTTPEVTGPVWVTLVPLGTTSLGRPEGAWPLATDPVTYSIDPNRGEPSAPAGTKIDDPSDATKLRAFGASFRDGDFGATEPGDDLLTVGPDGTRYLLWMRDVMPGEDATGLTHLF